MTDSPVDLAIALAPRRAHPALMALFALDARLADIVASTSEPLIGQLRLAWWREALVRLDTSPAPAEPVLRDLARLVLPHGVTGAELAAMTEGWEAVLMGQLPDQATLTDYATQRGAVLFGAAARMLGTDPTARMTAAGRGWALAALCRHGSDASVVDLARRCADAAFDETFAGFWPRAERPLGILAMLAARDLVTSRDLARRWPTATAFIRFRLIGRR
ncbi:squalene/phytoene synthase family protein [Sphingomonas oligophenolica]|uniref:Phytoene synthase n=1 Tax=Sphingomonas oligophenolica TaxID=301154 RepID=A0A502CM30_9SPHN|nr:squalene/phytoene synthase family protein [Sphingomonas oligophenolica]TPG14247.1 hypothetical protein EAH84_02695 [Sphingomonas oligophenolica]